MKNRFLRYFFPALVAGPLSVACMHAITQVSTPPVFSARNVTADIPQELQGRGVRRVRAVEINLDEISATQQPVLMNFFPGVDLNIRWEKSQKVDRPAGTVWTGTVVGSPLGQATLVVPGRNVTGNITRGDGLMYQIRTTADGRWWVREIDQKEFPRDSEPVVPNL
jgi:hypothetical protein